MFFLDSENGWAVGDYNYVLHTNDAGNTWSIQQNGSGQYLREVFFLDQMNGWIASSSGLLKTTDGGLNWNTHIAGSFRSVQFLDQNEGWASSSKPEYMGYSGILLHTTDAFDTWDTIYICYGGFEYSCGFYSINFKDPNNGWMLKYDCSSGGWFSGCSYGLIKTNDGGNTWEGFDLPIYMDHNAFCFTPEGKGCLVSDRGVIFNTTNWDDPWNLGSEGNNIWFNDIEFPDNLNGWAVGSESNNALWPGHGSIILHTSDGGNTWSEQNSIIEGYLESVSFIDSNNGWTVGYSNGANYILNTINGGNEWQIQRWDTGYYLNSIYFTNDSDGWTVGINYNNNGYTDGLILKTSDGGNNWVQQDCDTCHGLNDVYFVDQQIGWTVGNSIYATVDGGQNWTEQFYCTTGFDLESVYFIDNENGWVVGRASPGYEGVILKTVDGGSNWSYEIVNTRLYSIQFKDINNGLISGSDGLIMITNDAGTSWELQNSGTNKYLYSICYTSEGHGYAAGEWGAIVHSGSLITPVNENYNSKNLVFDIHCFPNPFSETTTLSYSLVQKSFVSIEIYNSQGQFVFKQKEEVKSEGQHKMIFGSQNLPVGIYFCVFKTNEGIQTIKIIKH